MQNLGNNTIMPVVEPAPLNKVGQYVFKINYSYQTPLPECARANPPCSIQPLPVFNFMAGQAVDGNVSGENVIISPLGLPIPMSVLALNPLDARNTASRLGGKEQEERDVLTGGWMTMLFPKYGGANYRILFRWALILLVIFLIVKYGVPYFKKQFAK